MNRIYWDVDRISILTDSMDASSHSHAMMQFFLCAEDKLNIKIGKNKVDAECILVNKNVSHSFKADKKICLTVIIEPVSDFGMALDELLKGRDYLIIDRSGLGTLKEKVILMKDESDKVVYPGLKDAMYGCFDLVPANKVLDERIAEFLDMLDHCDCEDHSIDEYAGKLCLSSSRFSHLFSEQVGIPIKKYLILHQLEKAFEAILQGESITTASVNAGFDSPSHFAATVKKLMGLPARRSVKDSVFLKVY